MPTVLEMAKRGPCAICRRHAIGIGSGAGVSALAGLAKALRETLEAVVPSDDAETRVFITELFTKRGS